MTEPNQSDAKLFTNFLLICLTIACLGVFWLWLSEVSKPVTADSTAAGFAAYDKGDYVTAFKALRAPAEQGNHFAQFRIGYMYESGNGVAKDEKIGAEWYRKSADQGDAKAQRNLGGLYYRGEGVPKDLRLAAEWYRKSADQGDAGGQYNLGAMYYSGRGVPKDLRLAAEWYRKSADQGDTYAQTNLGYLYSRGEGVSKDLRLAAEWFRKSANQGNADAQRNMGLMYYSGEGVPKDLRLAAEWYRKSADQGNAVAQAQLGFMYSRGEGVPKDLRLSAEWYRKSADQGDADSQLLLGWAYADGEGVPRDSALAYFWYLLSSAQGNATAIQKRDAIEPTLTTAQKNQAQSAASNWKPNQSKQSALGSGAQQSQNTPEISGLTVESTGTGFALTKTAFISNAHVVANCAVVKVNGQPATVKAVDARSDLAIISVNHTGDVAKLSSVRIRQGDPITVVGFPLRGLLASGAQVTAGNVSALAGMGNDSRFIQISAPVQSGNSGGPLVDGSGNVVGVVVSKLNAIKMASITGDIPQNVNFAISPLVLQAFLEANGVEYQHSSATKNMSTADVADVAKKYTSLVECYK